VPPSPCGYFAGTFPEEHRDDVGGYCAGTMGEESSDEAIS